MGSCPVAASRPAEAHRVELAVPGALGGEIAPHQDDTGYREPAEVRRRGLRDGPSKRRAGFSAPPSRIEDTADGEMRMPGFGVTDESAALESGGDFGLNRPQGERALGRADPENPRPLHAWEGAKSVKRQREGRGGSRFIESAGGVGQSLLVLLAEKLQRQVQVR